MILVWMVVVMRLSWMLCRLLVSILPTVVAPVCDVTPVSTVLDVKLLMRSILWALLVQAILMNLPLGIGVNRVVMVLVTVCLCRDVVLLVWVILVGPYGACVARQSFSILVVVVWLGWLRWTPMLRCLGCRTVGLTRLLWPAVLTMTMPLSDLILLTLVSSRGMTADLMLSSIFDLWAWNRELTLLKNIMIGCFVLVILWVWVNASWTRCLALLMHPPSSLGFPMPRKKELVEPVIVPVTTAPL